MIGQALRAHARTFAGDIVLLWVVVAAFAVSLSLATSIPPELAEAPADVRTALTAPFTAVLATYGAVLASVYGSFRYTLDRRDGVVAQRLMLQPRWVTLLVRAPASALGGAVVALAGLAGGHAALAFAIGGIALDGTAVGSTLALGAIAGLWGMGLGIVVQAHLVALFAASLSMGAGLLVAILWKAGAVYLPLLAMLQALRFDVAAVGIMPGESLDGSTAVLVTAGWVTAALLAGWLSFMNRDVR
ncbi:hypothetical protein [Microbacterium sp. TPD7012]|uniref:hypothetical protein n=1 Tax=Microbacterium sp. TPD7012 TaxID=2171975 RepID=UPI000D50F31E|nr:hypothetical protein [Microbacterium sp. TPD7012]PVE94903.1 hypothetical protein DC434_13265 [Microbacterium sp. TPD7012]